MLDFTYFISLLYWVSSNKKLETCQRGIKKEFMFYLIQSFPMVKQYTFTILQSVS